MLLTFLATCFSALWLTAHNSWSSICYDSCFLCLLTWMSEFSGVACDNQALCIICVYSDHFKFLILWIYCTLTSPTSNPTLLLLLLLLLSRVRGVPQDKNKLVRLQASETPTGWATSLGNWDHSILSYSEIQIPSHRNWVAPEVKQKQKGSEALVSPSWATLPWNPGPQHPLDLSDPELQPRGSRRKKMTWSSIESRLGHIRWEDGTTASFRLWNPELQEVKEDWCQKPPVSSQFCLCQLVWGWEWGLKVFPPCLRNPVGKWLKAGLTSVFCCCLIGESRKDIDSFSHKTQLKYHITIIFISMDSWKKWTNVIDD